MSLIEINNLSKAYDHNKKKIDVIKNFSLSCNPNDFYCIVGKSGCGKSTLLKIIAGFDRDYSGSIKSDGKLVISPDTDRMMLFQDENQLFPWKTVFDNIFVPLKKTFKNTPREVLKNKVFQYLSLVGLENYENYYPHQLSGGMKQRVAIARALSLEPLVLLMDEPFSALDALTRESLQDLLLDIWEQTNTTIIFVTHNIEEAIKLGTHILVMDFPPNSVGQIIENKLNHSSKAFTSEFAKLYEDIRNQLNL